MKTTSDKYLEIIARKNRRIHELQDANTDLAKTVIDLHARLKRLTTPRTVGS